MLHNIPWKTTILSIGIGLFVCLAILAILSAGIFWGKIPEIYLAARGVVALGACLSAALAASFAVKNKMLIALCSGAVFYLLLVFIGAAWNPSWDLKAAEFCLLFSAAGTAVGGVCGTLSKTKTKKRTKRRSSK